MSLYQALDDINRLKEVQEQLLNEGKNLPQTVSKEGFAAMEMAARNAYGDYSKGAMSVREAITSTDTMYLIPKVIEGQLREATEPEYLGTRFFNKVKVDENTSSAVYVIPIVGELKAAEVVEGGRYQEDRAEISTLENATLEIRVKKYGCRVSITEEALSDSSWDILGINVRKMGQAMGRLKEELIFNNFTKHGHLVFDNNQRQVTPEAGTTGLGKDGQYNDTLSIEDFLDLTLALLGNGFNPTDVIMHPLVWVVFAKNSMIGNGLTFGALGGNNVHPNGAIQGTPAAFGMANNGDGQKFVLSPDQVQNRLPFGLTVSMSPWVNFDKLNKKFDMYCLDRNEVGIIAQKEEVKIDQWIDPERDIKLLKVKERYGIGILNNGRAITVAKNIAVAPTYPAQPVINIRSTDLGTGYPTQPTF